MYDNRVSRFLWCKNINTINYLINGGPTCANLKVTLEIRYNKSIPNINYLKILRCMVYLNVFKEKRKKLISKTIKDMFVEYDELSRA